MHAGDFIKALMILLLRICSGTLNFSTGLDERGRFGAPLR